MPILLADQLAFNPGAALARVIHVGAAVIAAGGAFFQFLVLRPTLATLEDPQRLELREKLADRWRVTVYRCIVVLLISGFINYLVYRAPAIQHYENSTAYHILLGIKILLALAAFHCAALLALSGPRGKRHRDHAGFWLTTLCILFVVIIGLGSVLRTLEP